MMGRSAQRSGAPESGASPQTRTTGGLAGSTLKYLAQTVSANIVEFILRFVVAALWRGLCWAAGLLLHAIAALASLVDLARFVGWIVAAIGALVAAILE